MILKTSRLALVLTLLGRSAIAGETDSPADSASPPGGSKAPADDSLSGSQTGMKTEKGASSADAKNSDDAAKTNADHADHAEAGENDTFGHGMQFGLRAGLVFGYKIDFRYDRSPLCHAFDNTKSVTDQEKVCGFGEPPATELALSFAPFDSIEPYVFGRFGFSGESPTNTNALFLFGAGARIYTMSDSRFKIFVEPAVAYEGESGAGNPAWSPGGLNPSYKKDFIFHVGIGPEYDFAKAFGAFLNVGLDVGILRDISALIFANIGVQLRVP